MLHFREMLLEQRDGESRTVEASLSSEAPVYRPGLGDEKLMHTVAAVDLSRAPLPLLTSHNRSETPVGVVENLRLAAGKLRGTLRFGESARAKELLADVKAGVLRSLSIGYEILEGRSVGDEYHVTKWRPYEASLVAVPADPSVGIGRSYGDLHFMENITEHGEDQGQHLSRSQRRAAHRAEDQSREAATEVYALAEQLGISNAQVRSFADIHGHDLDAFRAHALKLVGRMGGGSLRPSEEPEIGLTKREAERFSFVRAIRAQIDPEFARREAGFELECSRAYAKLRGREAQGIGIPPDVLHARRDLTVGSPAGGGYLKPTDHLAEGFIDVLRAKAQVFGLGATQLTGLRGDVQIPKKTGAAGASWVDEGSAAPQSDMAVGQVALAPKTVAGHTVFTRKMMLQASPDIEMLVRLDLADSLGVEMDRAAIAGSGSGSEPTGILNIVGVGSVAIGTNGGAPTWDHVLDLEQALAGVNADTGLLAYLGSTAIRRKLKGTLKVTADAGAGFCWENGREPGEGVMNGYRALASNNVPSNLTKGTGTSLSALVFGNWSDLVVGIWGGLDLLVDPYSLATSGGYRVVAMLDCDIAVRRVQSFATITDAVTT